MRLWTIQPPEAVDIIEKTGRFSCEKEKSENYKDFRDAYLWLVEQMDMRKIYHPEGLILPLWAWHTRDWKHKKPDFRTTGLDTPGKRCSCIEFEIDDSQVLLSDYYAWHSVLNNGYLNNSQTEEEWDKENARFDTLSGTEKEKLILESWQNIFDVEPYENDFFPKGKYIQAVFWALKKDMIRDIRYFIAR